MGTTWGDVAWELAHAEEEWQEVVKGISEDALVQFAEERYTAYFKSNAEMHLPVWDMQTLALHLILTPTFCLARERQRLNTLINFSSLG